MIFEVPGVSFGVQKWVQNGVRIASSTRKASRSLLEASWSALGGSWRRKKYLGTLLSALTALSEPKTLRLEPQDPPIKPDQVVGPESTDVIICLRPSNHLPTSCNHLPTS